MIETLREQNPEDYKRVLQELDFDILEQNDEEQEEEEFEEEVEEYVPEDQVTVSGKKPKNRHLNPNHSEKGQETRKDEQQKSKTKDVKNGKKEASNKSKKGAVKKKRVLQSFDFNKLKKIDIGTQEFGKTEKKEKGGKNGFVYTPRKLKNNNRRKKDFNEKIVNRIKKITTKYGHQH